MSYRVTIYWGAVSAALHSSGWNGGTYVGTIPDAAASSGRAADTERRKG